MLLPQARAIASTCLPMARRKTLSDDLRNALIYMHTQHGLPLKTIASFTNISLRTVQHIVHVWKYNGVVSKERLLNQGRPRALDYTDTQACCALLSSWLRQVFLVFLVPVWHAGPSQ